MAGFDYAKAQATAARLITRFGGAGKLHKFSRDGGGNPVYTPHDITIVMPEVAKDRTQPGEQVKSFRTLAYVAALNLTPEIEINDRIEDADGKTYEIAPPLRPLRPYLTTVYYELQLVV